MLITLLDDHGIEFPAELRDAADLTRHAVVSRYPGVVEEVTEGDLAEAVRLAEGTVAWAESIGGGAGGTEGRD